MKNILCRIDAFELTTCTIQLTIKKTIIKCLKATKLYYFFRKTNY